jgi:hypothetical protein
MPEAFMTLCPAEFEIMRESKINILKLSNPYLTSPKEEDDTEDKDTPKQSQEEQMQMITMANELMGGS